MDEITVIDGVVAEGDGEKLVTVENAASYLGVTERRVRAIINPICYCVTKNREKNLEGARSDCRLCGGSGKPEPRLASIRVGKQFFIRRDDLVAYDQTRKK